MADKMKKHLDVLKYNSDRLQRELDSIQKTLTPNLSQFLIRFSPKATHGASENVKRCANYVKLVKSQTKLGKIDMIVANNEKPNDNGKRKRQNGKSKEEGKKRPRIKAEAITFNQHITDCMAMQRYMTTSIGTFVVFPKDIMDEIVDYLDFPEVNQMSLVNRTIHQIIGNSTKFKKLCSALGLVLKENETFRHCVISCFTGGCKCHSCQFPTKAEPNSWGNVFCGPCSPKHIIRRKDASRAFGIDEMELYFMCTWNKTSKVCPKHDLYRAVLYTKGLKYLKNVGNKKANRVKRQKTIATTATIKEILFAEAHPTIPDDKEL